MKTLVLIIVILVSVSVSGCATVQNKAGMSDVMRVCDDSTHNFKDFVDCTKYGYIKYGRLPNDPGVRRFYYMLDAINEKYKNNTLSQTESMVEAYRAYDETIGASNREIDREMRSRPVYQYQPPPAYQVPIPQQRRCTSTAIGNQINTTCQ